MGFLDSISKAFGSAKPMEQMSREELEKMKKDFEMRKMKANAALERATAMNKSIMINRINTEIGYCDKMLADIDTELKRR